jgi:hypothetical protein
MNTKNAIAEITEIMSRPFYYLGYGVDLRVAPSTRERALRVLKEYRHEAYLAWKAWVNIAQVSPEEIIHEDERRDKISEYKAAFYKASHLVGVIEDSDWEGGWEVVENWYGGYSPYHCTAFRR